MIQRGYLISISLLLFMAALLWLRFGGPGAIEAFLGFTLLFALGFVLLVAGLQRTGTLRRRLAAGLGAYLVVGLLVAVLLYATNPQRAPTGGVSAWGATLARTVLLWPAQLTDWLPVAPELTGRTAITARMFDGSDHSSAKWLSRIRSYRV